MSANCLFSFWIFPYYKVPGTSGIVQGVQNDAPYSVQTSDISDDEVLHHVQSFEAELDGNATDLHAQFQSNGKKKSCSERKFGSASYCS